METAFYSPSQCPKLIENCGKRKLCSYPLFVSVPFNIRNDTYPLASPIG
ncbi:unnamed protein product [Haemonchus placei]|uniref:Uncharacterized protein n=1 Tax=Haemonchus placei TaxID=6290 RepID=A0A0N4WA68_HAEPC|nr:unnamed protein product [Haemonchus placei]